MPHRGCKSSHVTVHPHTDSDDACIYGLGSRTFVGSGTQAYMDTPTSAKLAKAAYQYGDFYGTEKQRKNNTNELIKETGFRLLPRFSGRQISVFAKTLPGGGTHLHIAHKGTRVGTIGGLRDLVSDARIAVGDYNDGQFEERRKDSEKAVLTYNPDVLTMSGHSLGGATISEAILRSKILRQRVNQADTFNAASSPFFGGPHRLDLSDSAEERLNDVMTHHRIKHDIASKGLKYKAPPGDVVTYKLTSDDPSIGITEDTLDQLNTAQRAIKAHDLDKFTSSAPLETSTLSRGGEITESNAVEAGIKAPRENELDVPLTNRDEIEGRGKTDEKAMLDDFNTMIGKKANSIKRALNNMIEQRGGSNAIRKAIDKKGPVKSVVDNYGTSNKSVVQSAKDVTAKNTSPEDRIAGARVLASVAQAPPAVQTGLHAAETGAILADRDASDTKKAGAVGGFVGATAGEKLGEQVGTYLGVPGVGGEIGGKMGEYWKKRGPCCCQTASRCSKEGSKECKAWLRRISQSPEYSREEGQEGNSEGNP